MAVPERPANEGDPYETRSAGGGPYPPNGNLPVPDPTRQTTQLVDRALAAFREVVETRLAALDRAIELADKGLTRERDEGASRHNAQREEIERAAMALRELFDSKLLNISEVMSKEIEGIDRRFVERDVRTEQAAQESRISLGAALAAAKEAVAEQNTANAKAISKSEDATEKQLDSIRALMSTSIKGLEDKIADVKGRLDRGEGQAGATAVAKTDHRQSTADSRILIFGIVAAIGTVIGVVGAIVGLS